MSLLDRLPKVRGHYAEQASMAHHTWFGVGGPADVIFCPADASDLGAFLAACPLDIPILAVGAGSNLLVRDGGVVGELGRRELDVVDVVLVPRFFSFRRGGLGGLDGRPETGHHHSSRRR